MFKTRLNCLTNILNCALLICQCANQLSQSVTGNTDNLNDYFLTLTKIHIKKKKFRFWFVHEGAFMFVINVEPLLKKYNLSN